MYKIGPLKQIGHNPIPWQEQFLFSMVTMCGLSDGQVYFSFTKKESMVPLNPYFAMNHCK